MNVHGFVQVSREDCRLLPELGGLTGLGWVGGQVQKHLDGKRSGMFFHATPEVLAAWQRVIDAAKRAGRYPVPEPEVEHPPVPKDEPIVGLWDAIDRAAGRTPGDDAERFIAELKSILAAQKAPVIKTFARELKDALKRANTWDLWAAAHILNGGCSDDGFEYFRGWLVAQGKDAFERAVADPDSLADLAGRYAAEERGELEEMLTVADEAFEWAHPTKDWPESLILEYMGIKPKGRAFKEDDEADLKRRLPRLFQRHAERENRSSTDE